MNTARAAWVIVLSVATGCVGRSALLGAVESEGASAGGSEEGSEGGTSGGAGGSESSTVGGSEDSSGGSGGVAACEDVDVGEGMERLLDDQQYANTIRDLFGIDYAFPIVGQGQPFPTAWSFDPAGTYATAAGEVAALVDIGSLAACSLDVTGAEADACAVQLVEELGPRAFRHPLTDAERDDLLAIANAGAPTLEERLRAVVGAVLSHPSFVRPTVTGSTAPEGEPVIELDAYSLATRLSYFVWNSTPDAELLAAAGSGALLDAGELATQTERLLADQRARVMQGDLYEYMLGARDLPQRVEQPGLGAAMQGEQRRFVADVTANGSVDDLLGATHSFINADLAAIYGDHVTGTPPAGNAFEEVQLDARREGVLTRLAFLSAHSRWGTFASPARRGKALIQAFYCVSVPPPPPGVDVEPPEEPFPDTFREQWEQHVADPACAACHTLIDGPGWAFGNYDPLGRWIDEIDGQPIDPAGELPGSGDEPSTEFADLLELLAIMRDDTAVWDCLAQRYYEFAVRRWLTERDACTLEQLGDAFEAEGGNFDALVHAIVQSRAFRLARPVED